MQIIQVSPSNTKQPPKNEPFSDASSSYWAPRWSWARYSDLDVDFSTLSEEEREKMRFSLQDVLGGKAEEVRDNTSRQQIAYHRRDLALADWWIRYTNSKDN
ncbi:hypothetical protein V490_08344 [Pseudogymnoascus sp. VKM F-3557]|nr:hypothetical protein V490_08344 [Pseudogymnoascus sp. VKM F-3557]